MCFSMDDARHLLACISEALQEIEKISTDQVESIAARRRLPGQAPHRLAPKPLDLSPVADMDDILLDASTSAGSPSSASDDSGLDLSPTRVARDEELKDLDVDLSRPKKRQKIESN
jgi:hypothetical protein